MTSSWSSFGSWFHGNASSEGPKWKDRVLDSESSTSIVDVGLGLRFRSSVDGPEQRFVDSFLSTLEAKVPTGRKLTIFCQPALATGYPDLVAVIWKPSIAKTWPQEREHVSETDLQLLHALANLGWSDISSLERIYRQSLDTSLTRLDELGLVYRTKRMCRARSLNRIFAVEKIIAIEAKMSLSDRVIQQAQSNTWFSSESIVLFPKTRLPKYDINKIAKRHEVGFIAFNNSTTKELCRAPEREVPLSYGSWLFNEWVWRIARRRGDFK